METTIIYWGYMGIMEKKMEPTIVYWGFIGMVEKKMETTIVYWGYIGIMETKRICNPPLKASQVVSLGGVISRSLVLTSNLLTYTSDFC